MNGQFQWHGGAEHEPDLMSFPAGRFPFVAVEGDGICDVGGDVREASPDGRAVQLAGGDVPQPGAALTSLDGTPSGDKDMRLCLCLLRASLDGRGGGAVAIDHGICQALMEIFQLAQMRRGDDPIVAEVRIDR
jgi:hypothetical protein